MAQLRQQRDADVKAAVNAIQQDKSVMAAIYGSNPGKIQEYEEVNPQAHASKLLLIHLLLQVQAERLDVRQALQSKLATQVNSEILLSSSGEREAGEARLVGERVRVLPAAIQTCGM